MKTDRATRRVFAALAACCVLAATAACTGSEARPRSSASTVVADASPSTTPLATPVGPSPTVDAVVDVTRLMCVPPNDRVLDWLHDHGAARADLGASQAVMVEVGPGNDPADVWWVVGVATTGTDGGTRPRDEPLTFLTTAPGTPGPDTDGPGAGKWISLEPGSTAYSGPAGWGAVSWTGERLARGKQAQSLALSCLDAAR